MTVELWTLILTAVDVVLLVALVVQGEYIRFYEREVHRIHSEREKERAAWREQKRKQGTKKTEQKAEATKEITP